MTDRRPNRRVLAVTTSPVAMGGTWDVRTVETVPAALTLLEAEKTPIVLFDRDLPGADWRTVLAWMAKRSPASCILLLSRVCDDYLWKEVVRCGGYDVIPKPLSEPNVEQTLQKAWTYWAAGQVKQ